MLDAASGAARRASLHGLVGLAVDEAFCASFASVLVAAFHRFPKMAFAVSRRGSAFLEVEARWRQVASGLETNRLANGGGVFTAAAPFGGGGMASQTRGLKFVHPRNWILQWKLSPGDKVRSPGETSERK